MSELKVVQLNSGNFRDAPRTLRVIADEIEAGEYGNVDCVGVVIKGDTLEAFGVGPAAEMNTICVMFMAAASRLVNNYETMGR